MSETKKGTPKRGVSLYSYSELYRVSMTLEDCLMDVHDLGATYLEILSGHVENYPNPTSEWVDQWWRLMEKYKVKPGGYGHWCDTHMYKHRRLTMDETLNHLVRDFKLANLLGFKFLRTKIATDPAPTGSILKPEPGWGEYIKRALDYAEKYDVVMCTELSWGETLDSEPVVEYLNFIEKNKSDRFGFCIDFSLFQNKPPQGAIGSDMDMDMPDDLPPDAPDFGAALKRDEYMLPEELLQLLPYTRYCHGKFNYIDDNYEEPSIPYKEVLQVLLDNNWDSFIVSEFEGANKEDADYVSDQLRRQHIMMKRILGN